MHNENLIIDRTEEVVIISIHRPESLNALNSKTLKELQEPLLALQNDSSARVIIITGSGDKAFVAGADIKEFTDLTPAQAKKYAQNGQEIFNIIENYTKPIIACINGFALGGGLELALSCHLRYASKNAKLGLPEVALGLIPGFGGTQRLPKVVGKGRANEMIFTAKMISAEKAKEIGLVQEIFESNELLESVKKIALIIAQNSSQAITKAIKSINASDTISGFNTEIENFGELFDMKDKKEGVQAFIEKRKPNFKKHCKS